MSQLFSFVESLEAKVKDFESKIQQSIMNHNALLGMLQATKETLVEAHKANDAMAADLNVADELANVVGNVIDASFEDVPQ